MHKSYKKLAKYYDAMHQRRNYKKEANFIIKRIFEINPKAKSLIDVGCGTGTHLKLIEKRFSVLYGVDLNEEILEIARKKTSNIKYVQGNMQTFKINKRFDCLISLYSVFNYNLTLKDARKTLINFYKHLKSKGVLIIALYNPQNAEEKVSLHAGGNKSFKVAKVNEHVYNPKTKIETSNFFVIWKDGNEMDFDIEKNHKMRIFKSDEIHKMLIDTGFNKPTFYNKYSDRLADGSDRFPILVAQKK